MNLQVIWNDLVVSQEREVEIIKIEKKFYLDQVKLNNTLASYSFILIHLTPNDY